MGDLWTAACKTATGTDQSLQDDGSAAASELVTLLMELGCRASGLHAPALRPFLGQLLSELCGGNGDCELG